MTINEIISILKQLPYFTKQNLGLALEQEGENLNYWIKKLLQEKLIVPLKNGVYISPLYQDTMLENLRENELYWVYLANILRTPSYVSTEYVLSTAGLIPESVFAMTSITLKSSRIYKTDKITFIYRNLKPKLFFGFNQTKFGPTGLTAMTAFSYKALFDFLYLKVFRNTFELTDYLLESGRINWDAFSLQDKQSFQEVIIKSGSQKMLQVLKILTKAKIL